MIKATGISNRPGSKLGPGPGLHFLQHRGRDQIISMAGAGLETEFLKVFFLIYRECIMYAKIVIDTIYAQ